MSGSKCAFLSAELLDHALGGGAYTAPTTVFIALSTDAFDPSSTGGSFSEVSASDYNRVSLANNSTTWSAASGDVPSMKSNNIDVVWPTATSDWGIPQSAYVCDSSSGGNALYGADISNPQAVGAGDTPRISAGAFVFTED